MFVVGFIVFIIAIVSVIKIAANRVAAPTNDLKEGIVRLEKRGDEFENEKKNNT
ncbi:hypothetical protein J2Z83_003151 [Virgibacillus natechei]|uniref:Uncharacterized protein n=1 Tax=Virgibacillus natechei TaxID=1216297 RepID=A0ABS4IJ91_9BACI|nr:hypothetical protein [Virgibacillus natechei]MBP1971014.1 hypothetical protein [Virgibacillus natechei]UZD12771.1 hypothetical protein OLD84_18075 [Virgibacillus natechei]